MESYGYLLIIAIILLSTKVLGVASGKISMPQVVGALVAGLILGPSVLGVVNETELIVSLSEIGVIMLMFDAGLGTDLKELKTTGVASFVIAIIGVIVPLVGGMGLYMLYFPNTGDTMYMLEAVFIGVILTATSVSITVETLRELGKLQGKVGTAIMGAAVIDDILGIVVLTIVSSFTDPDVQIGVVLLKIVLFFVFVAVVGFLCYHLFKRLDSHYKDHMHRRVAIFGLSFALIMSFCAEYFFGVADITGAYFAGLLLCNLPHVRKYISRRVSIVSYMFFSPIFFASVGIKTDLRGLTPSLLIFGLLLLVVAILTKIVGCGLGAKICGFSTHDSVSIGVGMVSRGEVALIVAQKGASCGLVSESMFAPVILVVIVTTLITPILLKLVMSDKAPKQA
jgi:Kef-type K+ transport system membrane component KefB